MNALDQFSKLSASDRHRRLRHGDTLVALTALGTDASIAWLAKHIESPIGPEWGRLLYDLKPSWQHLSAWMRQSKLHCLAAIDALMIFAAADSVLREKDPPVLPNGADPKSINAALDTALTSYGNPRLHDAAKKIRYVWPIGPRPRHVVSVPAALNDVANILFRGNADLLRDWHESMATARTPPAGAAAMYDSLLEFAETKQRVAIVDWQESSEEITARLRDLQSAQGLKISWDLFANYSGGNEKLFRTVSAAMSAHGHLLVCLDHGSDNYPLTVLPSEMVPKVQASIASLGDPEMKLVAFK
jgi:hypothetical protein